VTDVARANEACRRLRPALGTFVSVCAVADARGIAERSVAAAFDCFAVVQRLMHPTSGLDLVAIRTAQLNRPIRVHRWTWDVLSLSAEVNDISEGRFDPCVPERRGCMSDVDLPEPEVVVLRRQIALDLGGIAKGFAVDRAVERLTSAGCVAGEVNAGGDVRVFGLQPTPLWLRTQREVRCIELRDRACAVSDPLARDRPTEHRGYYSRVAPTGEVNLGSALATVVASTAAVADALTKCVLLCGKGDTLLKRTLLHFDATSIDLDEGRGAGG
jgi:thiamine biosynthesis lipoprotein